MSEFRIVKCERIVRCESRSWKGLRDEPFRIPDSQFLNQMPEYDTLSDLYDLENAHDYDLPFWLSLAKREAGPVIEWGAGTGRIAVPLSVCAFNSFLCLKSVDDALAFLRNAHEHLVPGGLLGIEVSAFSPEELVDLPGGPVLRHDFTRDLVDGRLERLSVSRYDSATQLMHMRLFYERYDASGTLQNRRAHDLTIRIVGQSELDLMLRLTGFQVEAVYGGFEGEPFTSTSDHLIVLSRK